MTTGQIYLFTDLLPEGCTFRNGRLEDYVQASELGNALSMHINGVPMLQEPDLLLLEWQSEGFNPEEDVLAVFGPEGRLLGMAENWRPNRPPVHPWTWIAVQPDYLESGIWEFLLRWGEERSRQALEMTPADIRVAPRTGADHLNRKSIDTIERLGWQYMRSYYRMMADLSELPEVPALPQGISIRPYDPTSETEAFYRAFVDSFKDHFGFVEQPFERGFALFKHLHITEPGYDPAYWFVAVQENEIVGICMCRRQDAEDPHSGLVKELGVRRAWRKQGIGQALLKYAFAAFYAAGQKKAVLGVDSGSLTGALRLYQRAGMKVMRQYDNFEKELRAGREISTEKVDA